MGNYDFYVNGTLKVGGLLKLFHEISDKGSLIIGGKYSSATNTLVNPFLGTMSCLQMWASRLSSETITTLFEAGKCEKMFDPFFNWYEVKKGTAVGNVTRRAPSSITEDKAGRSSY